MTAGAVCATSYFGYGIGTLVAICSTLTDSGMLSDTTFSLTGSDYTILSLVFVNTSGKILNFYVGGTITPTNNLVLQLDSREFAFSVANYDSTNMLYRWDSVSPDLIWPAGEMVSVKLCVNE